MIWLQNNESENRSINNCSSIFEHSVDNMNKLQHSRKKKLKSLNPEPLLPHVQIHPWPVNRHGNHHIICVVIKTEETGIRQAEYISEEKIKMK